MEARCRGISVQTVLRTTLSASMRRLPRCVCTISPSSWALTRHIRNEGHQKGAWNVSGIIDMFQPLREGMWKASSHGWKKWRTSYNGYVVRLSSVPLQYLIQCSSVRTPTLRKNWERRLIGKPLVGTRCRAPFRINLALPHTDRRRNCAPAPSAQWTIRPTTI